MGGQGEKKWLSYREEALLFSEVVRRIAALLLLGPDLDANYAAVKADIYACPSSER